MTLEKHMRSNVVKILRTAGLDARPVENPVDPGFPDVEYVGGLIELKSAPGWPARPDTLFRLDIYTQEQRVWHVRRARAGGRIHVLVQVGPEFLLFLGSHAAAWLGRLNEAGTRSWACAEFTSLADLRAGLPKALYG